jgi:hypothetical protein
VSLSLGVALDVFLRLKVNAVPRESNPNNEEGSITDGGGVKPASKEKIVPLLPELPPV